MGVGGGRIGEEKMKRMGRRKGSKGRKWGRE